MVSVLASIKVKAGKGPEFLRIFKDNVPAVRQEKGCLEYFPAIDLDSKLAAQVTDPDLVTIIEKWATLEDLHTHLKAPHMQAYREKVKDLVAGVSLKVLREA